MGVSGVIPTQGQRGTVQCSSSVAVCSAMPGSGRPRIGIAFSLAKDGDGDF
jgi:hypothetical protein